MEEQKITDTVKVEPVIEAEPIHERVPKVTLRDVLDDLDEDDDVDSEGAQKTPSPRYQARHETKKQQEPNKIKQAIDRMLLCYCRMQDHAGEHEEDFSEAEVEAVTDMAIDLLVRVFPRLQGRSDEQTRTKALNYLKIYYELYQLKQTETRRQLFLDNFTDVIRLGEMEEFFLETSLEMAKPIHQFSAQLDAQVNDSRGDVDRGKAKGKKQKTRHH